MRFTLEQLPTFQNNKHQIVVANAGSGKTTILVEKYLNIMLQYPPEQIERIVAITFTRKAAAEMKQRIVSRLNNEIANVRNHLANNTIQVNNQEINPAIEFQRLINFREHITNARIQTIHSFCFSILKDYAVDIDLSPDFVLINESEKIETLDDLIFDTIEDILENQSDALNNPLINLLNNVSKSKINEIIKQLATDETQYNTLQPLYNLSFNEFRKSIDKNANELISNYLIEFQELLSIVCNTLDVSSAKRDDSNEILQYWKEFCDNFSKIQDNEIYYFLASHLEELKNFKIGNKQIINSNESLKKLYSLLDSFAKSKYDEVYLLALYNYSKTILELSSIIHKKYDNYKKDMGLIDYDDILWKTYYLLSNNPNILYKIKSNIDYLLVDEFQDTDSVQFEILKLIVPYNNSLENKIFVVGDPKQSIYGFRQADVRIINKMMSEIPSANMSLLKDFKNEEEILLYPNEKYKFNHDDESSYGIHRIKISHRLNLVNTAFVNQAFENILIKDNSPFSVDYEKFIIGRDIYNYQPEIDLSELDEENEENNIIPYYGRVKFLSTINKAGIELTEESDDTNPAEADLLAQYLDYIISSKMQIYDESLKAKRNIELKDIAILIRSRNKVALLTKALDKYGLPYILNTSENFFLTQEILDIVSFLKFLDNPDDDLAFASLAKSLFFSLDDNFLVELRKINPENSLWKNFQFNYKQNNYKNQEREIRAFKILEEYLNKFSEYNPLEIVQDFLYKTHYTEIFHDHPSKYTILNNINQFLEFVRNYNSRYIFSITDLITEIDKATEIAPQESEVTISDENAINILTIHGAKGLEFPVVAIYNMNAVTRKSSSYYISDKFGLTYKYYPDAENMGQGIDAFEEIETPDHICAKLYQRKIEELEEQRLLYVAMTRAKEFLILSSSFTLGRNDNIIDPRGFTKLLMESLMISTDDLLSKQYIDFETKVDVNNTNENSTIELKYRVEIIQKIEKNTKEENLNKIENSENNEPKFLLDDICSSESQEVISPTKLETYINSPREFIDKYILNIDTIDNLLLTENQNNDNNEITLPGSIRGTIIHQTLEQLQNWVNEDYSVNEQNLIISINDVLFENELSINEIQFNEIRNECIASVSADIIQSILKNNNKIEFEKKFMLPYQTDYLNAILDILYQDNEGNYHICDWKTNLIQSKNDFELLCEHYSLQMKFYAYMVSFLNPNQNIMSARLLFTRLAKDNLHNENWTHLFEWNRQELQEFENILNDYFPKIKSIDSLREYLISNL